MRPHIAIIDPAARVPELESFNHIARLSSAIFSYHLPCLFGSKALYEENLENIQGAVILGSGASVYDNDSWQPLLTNWCKKAIDKNIPIFGLCYGHQLLIHILGGKIDFITEDQKKLVGSRKVNFMNIKNSFTDMNNGEFIVSHREHAISLGDDCEVLASSSEVSIDGFAHSYKPIWGMQSHPEARGEFIQNQNLPISSDEKYFISGQRLMSDFFKFIELNS